MSKAKGRKLSRIIESTERESEEGVIDRRREWSEEK